MTAAWNPSSWAQRLPVIIFATVAVAICIYMGLYQWGFIERVWDPVFGKQTQQVLRSEVSHVLYRWGRMPDAILGAIAYLSDVIFAIGGSTRRWYDRPWLVMLFALDVIPLGLVSAILVCLQGAVVGSWCFLCLITAVISLTLVVLAYNEFAACLEFLWKVWKKERSKKLLWHTFWGRGSRVAADVAREMEAQHVGKNL